MLASLKQQAFQYLFYIFHPAGLLTKMVIEIKAISVKHSDYQWQIGYMFRLSMSHLQANCVQMTNYVSIILAQNFQHIIGHLKKLAWRWLIDSRNM
jgi:hypothetical protein